MELKTSSYNDAPILSEEELMCKLLCTDEGAAVCIELGCGEAKAAQSLASELPSVHIYAYEIDEKQHDKNLALRTCPPNLTFGKAVMHYDWC